MRSILSFTSILIAVLLCASCQNSNNQSRELILNPLYSEINSIYSIAKCDGPSGQYTTVVRSNEDGGNRFTQIFDNGDPSFLARVDSDGSGYIINGEDTILDTLSNEAIEMIRSHEFHKMHAQPEHFFNNISFYKRLDERLELFTASDRLNLPVTIIYDRINKEIQNVNLLNPIDTTESIQINYTDWMETENGPMVEKLNIVQAERDTFHFIYVSVIINL